MKRVKNIFKRKYNGSSDFGSAIWLLIEIKELYCSEIVHRILVLRQVAWTSGLAFLYSWISCFLALHQVAENLH